jgi:hypothetical protein
MKVEDLDLLRPVSKFIKLDGKEIDVSFIPCGITFEVDKIVQELSSMTQEEMLANGEKTNRAFELSVKLCVAFCSRKYPELDEEWFNENTDAKQIQAFSSAIKEALVRAYSTGNEEGSKNLKAPRKKNK